MTVLKGDDVKRFMYFLLENKCSFYHACQLRDLRTFMREGGIISKALGRAKGLDLTPYTSDERDKERGVDGMTYFNFSDFGHGFHHFKNRSTPNVYGPILLKFSPYVLDNAQEISVTLTSVSANGFERERDSLSLNDCQSLFKGRFIKNKTEIMEIFPNREVTTPEMNVLYTHQTASFHSLEEIICDPLKIDGLRLLEVVRSECPNHLVKERLSQNKELYNLLTEAARTQNFSLLESWIKDVESLPRHIVRNFFSYLDIGSIAPMENTSKEEREII